MANCNDLFQVYHTTITLPAKKRESLKKSKEILRERIRKWFAENQPEYKPQFYIQGSYKCKNGILYEDGTCDVDDGAYFLREPDVSGTTLQKWVRKAVEGHTTEPPQHLKKCIRVIYKDDCNVDIPVFYKKEKDAHPHLAIKNEDWGDDDPKEFVDWFKDTKDADGQLIRINRYLKDWAKGKRNKMPNGLCLTILAANHLTYNERDDICLFETIRSIFTSLNAPGGWQCLMSTFPNDDLFLEYDETLKKNFLSSLSAFITDAGEAIKTDSKKEASKKWQKHLKRFPVDQEEEKLESLISTAAAINSGEHYTSKSGQINLNQEGTKNKAHRFYGEQNIPKKSQKPVSKSQSSKTKN